MKQELRIPILCAVAIALGAITGCATFGSGTNRQASSLVDYLYPREVEHVDKPVVTELVLPLRVGVAFVPDNTVKNRERVWLGTPTFTEAQKMELMKNVSDQFKQLPFVRSIQLIPSAYMTPGGGFENLEQLKAVFGIDVIALLSYDQAQFLDEGVWSLSYWTVVGAVVARGEKNDTQTMMDAALYDLKSRKLLFRAPGLSKIKGTSSPLFENEQRRLDSDRGFKEAATNLVSNLQEQLVSFKAEVKSSPEEFKITTKPGYTASAGSFGWFEVLLLIGLCTLGLATREKPAATVKSRSRKAVEHEVSR
jgi:rhombotail lipoprotein